MRNRRASPFFVRNTNYCLLISLSALTLCALRGIALAQICNPTTIWTDANGSWFVDGNWNNHVPNSGTNAFIGNTGTANIGSAESADACDLVLGFGATESGTASVNSGRLTVGNELEVGGYGKGKLSITNGATVSAGLATIASLHGTSDSVGTVIVDAGALTITTRADLGGDNGNQGGIALMTLTNSAAVTVTNGYLRVYPSGTLTGNGTVSVNSGSGIAAVDGTLAPSGTLPIGGNLSFGANANMRCNVSSSSVDNAQVSGAGALDGKLSVTLNGFFTGDFTLLHASTLQNQFRSYSFTYTGCLSPSIRYVNGDVILHVESTCQ